MRLGKILGALFARGDKKESPSAPTPVERRDQSTIGKGKRVEFDLQDRLFKEHWDKRRDKALQDIEGAIKLRSGLPTAYSISRRGEQLKQEVLRAHRACSEIDMRGVEDQIFFFQKQGR